MYLDALERLAAAARKAGDLATAIRCLKGIIAQCPLKESAHRGLIEIQLSQGNVAEATRAFRSLRDLLHRELHVEPSEETLRLCAVLRRAPHTGAPPPPSSLRSLPRPLTSLIGRETERKEVAALLRAHRLVTLTGAGGVGKTRLAIQVAEEVAGEYPEGAAFVDLAPLSDPSLVVQAVANVLEVSGAPGRSILESLQAFLRSRSLLLVLDNCEHLIAECASLAETLLVGAASLRILATSRQALGIPGEWLLRTPSLSLPNDRDLQADPQRQLAAANASEAIRLFTERSRAVHASFELTGENLPAVAAICERLEGIPLALEMTAAQIRVFSPEEILDRLADRYRFVASDSTTAPSRQQTLEATLDWSYRLLTGPEQALLQRLSVFAGGVNRTAAATVCDRDGDLGMPVEEGIASLVDKSLLQRREGRSGRTRFSMLETVREYGGQRLERSGEKKEFRKRHAGYFLGCAEEWEEEIHGPRQGEVLGRLEEEHNNLRAALGWDLIEGTDPAEGLRLAGALHWFWLLHTHYAEGRRWIDLALRKNGRSEALLSRAKALQGAGQIAFYQTDSETCRSCLEESVSLYAEMGERREAGRSRVYLGAARLMLGDPDGARGCLEEGVSIGREEGDAWGLGMALWMLGVFWRTQDDEKALRCLRESEDVLARVGDRWALSGALYYLGELHGRRNDLSAARRCFEEALGHARETEDRMRMIVFLVRLGETDYKSGDQAAAKQAYEEAILLFERLDDPVTAARFNVQRGANVSEVYLHLGHIHGNLGDPEMSRSFYERGLALCTQLEDMEGRAEAEKYLATLTASG